MSFTGLGLFAESMENACKLSPDSRNELSELSHPILLDLIDNPRF